MIWKIWRFLWILPKTDNKEIYCSISRTWLWKLYQTFLVFVQFSRLSVVGNNAPLMWPTLRSKMYFYSLFCLFLFMKSRIKLDFVEFPTVFPRHNRDWMLPFIKYSWKRLGFEAAIRRKFEKRSIAVWKLNRKAQLSSFSRDHIEDQQHSE